MLFLIQTKCKFYLRLLVVKQDANMIEFKSSSNNNRAILYREPIRLEFFIGDYLVASFNSKNLLKFEHLRLKE